MNEPGFLSHDGKIRKSGIPLISPDNRSFRYGDGFFETMKMVHGKIILEDLHFERLFTSLDLFRFKRPAHFTPAYLREQVAELAAKNRHTPLARIRLTIFRGEGGLYEVEDHFPHHIIQSWELSPAIHTLNENGMVLGIYKEARKTCDAFSHVKSNNYLAYAMAALWAKEQKLNDALLLNAFNRVADASIANVFIVKDGLVKTPALSEGCVGGVMRKHLLQSLRKENMPVEETQLEIEEVMQASEIFLTNAIHGIKWVKGLGENGFTNQLSALLHKNVVQPLIA
jgi:branched-subunit amino acid aminotransferase/4-amino-4-deoxychorismate lyase